VRESELRLEAELKRAFFDLALAEMSLSVNQRVRGLLAAMVSSAESKYKVGRAPQAVLLKAQSELLMADNDRLDLERARDEGRARLNALLDRPQEAPLGPTALAAPAAALPAERELVALALAERPDVRLVRDGLAEAQARLEVARREAKPELAIWAGYMVNIRGVDMFSTGVSTTLPIFSTRRRDALSDAAQAELAAKRAALDGARRRAEAEVHIALLQMEVAERHEKLHSERLIPLAELSLQSAEAAYQNDRIDFLSVLDAARVLRDHHLNHARYLIDYQRRLADLELAVGQDLARKAAP
jgi:cobalt-zinc-cadmium efflux system outer membrane protein